MTRKTTAATHARGAHSRGRSTAHPRSVATLSDEREDAYPDRPFEKGAHDAIDPDLRHRLISEAAYSRYAGRGYADGYDFDDWLAAEESVDHLLLNRSRSASESGG